jgi:tight adherence protein B
MTAAGALTLTALGLLATPGPDRPERRLQIGTVSARGAPGEPRWAGALAWCARSAAGRRARWAGAAAVGLIATVTVGPGCGICAAVVLVVCGRAWADHRDSRTARQHEDALVEAIAAVAAEIRSGHTPAAALRAGGLAAGGAVGAALRDAASTAMLGGDAGVALAAAARAGPVGDGLGQVAAAWQVSARSGAALGAVLDRVERDLRSERARRRRLDAELAGPRATAALLAGLPVVGLGLGAAMGAHPARVLLHTAPGQVALATGAILDGLGVWWTARIVVAAGRGP